MLGRLGRGGMYPYIWLSLNETRKSETLMTEAVKLNCLILIFNFCNLYNDHLSISQTLHMKLE